MNKFEKGVVMLFLLLFAQCLLLFFHTQFNFEDFLHYLLGYWPNYIFNLFLLYILFLVFLVVFNRKPIAWFLFFSTIVLFSIANYFKISYRSEPLLPSDFSLIVQLNQIIQLMNISHMLISILLISLILFIFLILLRMKSEKVFSNKQRVILSLLLAFFIVSVFYSKHPNSPYQVVANFFGNHDNYWDLTEDYSQNGQIAGFLKNLDIIVMEEIPENYSIDTINEIVEKYKQKAIEMNVGNKPLDNQTVIFILSESFMDPLKIPDLELSDDPIPFIRKIKEVTTSGLMVGSNYGGGTANVEYEVLTSFSVNYFDVSLSIPYTLLVPYLNEVPNITNLFEHKIAIHSYNANLYRRREVFEKLGFDVFIYENGEYDLTYKDTKDDGSYISDESAYQEVLDLLKETTGNTFILLTTMQNHGPYTKEQYINQFEVINDLEDEEKVKIETYVQGLHYTDMATENFIKEIDEVNRPITVAFFGDHIRSDVFDSFEQEHEEALAFFETDYFVYSNFETEKLDYPLISPYTLGSLLIEQLKMENTPYYALVSDLKKSVPVIRWGEYYKNLEEIHIYEELPEDLKETIDDYKLIQYDINVGEQYSVDLGFFEFIDE